MISFVRCVLAAAALTIASGIAVQADAFRKIDDRSEFLSVVAGKTLRYPGVRLQVTPAGAIQGTGLGIPVRGAWQWRSGYFCRDLYWGERDLGPNCQVVLRNGNTLRFIAEDGQSADFRLR